MTFYLLLQQNFDTKCVLHFLFPTLWELFFTDFTRQQRDMGHSYTSQKFIKPQPQTNQVAIAEAEECSKMSICQLQRPILKGCKSQSLSTAVQSSNQEFEQDRVSQPVCARSSAQNTSGRCCSRAQMHKPSSDLATHSSSLDPETQ